MTTNLINWLRADTQLLFVTGVGLGLWVACATQQRPRAEAPEAQPYAEAIRQICDVDTLANIPVEADELARSRQREDYIVENTKNSDAIFFATIFRTKAPAEQAEMLAREARKSGLTQCALANSLTET